jgi:hypothetical protein
MASSRNPAYDCPDAHELAVMKALASSPHHFHLVASTRVQRRARASYWRKVARSLAAADQAAPSDQVVAADESAVV